jgi:SAM-dependent methyltransferase/uncharacterized protein YbaR (Trm112 family)
VLSTLLDYLACPTCGGDLSDDFRERDGDHVMTGALTCQGCEARYEIAGGVPRMNRRMEGLENISRTFGFEWKAHHDGKFEQETVYGHTPETDWRNFLDRLGTTDEEVRQSAVLDAGCGSGNFTRLAAEHGAKIAIGIDIHDEVDGAFAHCRELDNAHIVQGNVLAPPFKPAAFDLAWCSGVLHHTPDPAAGHRSLSRLVAPAGTLYVYVYSKRFNPFRFVKTLLDGVRITRLPQPLLLAFCKLISIPSLGLLQAYRLVRKLPPLRAQSPRALRTVRARGLREIQLTWFDALSPEFNSRHTEAEVVGWFRQAGFERITPNEEPKVSVRGMASP